MKTIIHKYGTSEVSEEVYELLSWIATIKKEFDIKQKELQNILDNQDMTNPYWQALTDKFKIRIPKLQQSLWGLETAAACMKIENELIWHTKEKPEDFRNMNRIAIIENLSPKS